MADITKIIADIIKDDSSMPDPVRFEYYRGLTTRELWIDTDIDEDFNVLNIVKQIFNFNRQDKGIPVEERKPIILYLFSCGGDLDICNSIIDAIQLSETPVYGVNVGRCLSAAAYIFISCKKRFMLPSAYFLFHQGSAMIDGTAEEIRKQIDNYNRKVKELSCTMTKYTKYSMDEIENNIKSEWYVSASEAIEKGVCDKVIENINEVII